MRVLRRVLLVGILVLATSGCTLYGWGYYNEFGQVGDGTTLPRFSPVAAAKNPDWRQVDAGFYHSCGIDLSGALSCWGNNLRGELGLGRSGPTAGTTVPTRVGTSNSWSAVSGGGASSGQGFTCGVRAGAVLCWGHNANGQLGVGDTTDRSVPAQVGMDTDWKTVSSGTFNSCAIKTNGALYCWGAGGGANGDGTVAERRAPVRVGTANDWKLVSVGGHACGTRGSALFCWGSNVGGQIGLGSVQQFAYTAPQRVDASIPWSSVAAGGSHTCGLAAGSVYCWGFNLSGELGNGSSGPYDPNTFEPLPNPVPTKLGTAADWTVVAAGESATCGIRSGGTLFCWGNTPIGDGTDAASSLVPAQALLDRWSSISLGVLHKVGLRTPG